MTTRKRCNHEHLIQHTCIRSTDVVSGLYLRSVHSGRNAFEVEVVVHGVIMEVVVLATVVEVAVHAEVVELDGSVTRVFGDGSGSSGTRSFSERYLTGPRSLGRR